MELKKSKEADLEGKSKIFRVIGLTMAAALVAMAFSATTATVAEKVAEEEDIESLDEEMVYEVQEQETPPPPQTQEAPPPPDLEEIEVVDDEEDIAELDLTNIEPEDLPVDDGPEEVQIEEEPIVDFAEVEPSFPGGDAAMAQFIRDNVQYPELAREMGEQGTVYVQFVVNSDGSIQDVEVIKGVSDLLNKEAVRVVKAMPKWTPGEQAGKKIRVRFRIPIKFTISG